MHYKLLCKHITYSKTGTKYKHLAQIPERSYIIEAFISYFVFKLDKTFNAHSLSDSLQGDEVLTK